MQLGISFPRVDLHISMGIDMNLKYNVREFLGMAIIVITFFFAVTAIKELMVNTKTDHTHSHWEESRQHYMEQCDCYVPPVNMDSIRAGILPEWHCDEE